MDEVLRLPAPGRCFQELVPDPGGGRTGGYVEVEQLSALVADKEEDVDSPPVLASTARRGRARSPKGILMRDPGDELPHLGAEMGMTKPGSRLPRPVKPPTLPMPAQDRLRLHHTEVLLPAVRPESAKPDPQDSILSPEPRTRVGAQRDLKLMAEDQVLEREISAGSNGRDHRTQHSEEEFGHPAG